MGDKGRQDVGKTDTPSNKGKQEGGWETRGNKTSGRRTHHLTQADKGRQDRGKADKPSKAEASSNTDTHVGRQGETRPWEGGPTIQHRHTCGDNGRQFGDKMSARRTQHVGRKWEIRLREGGHTIQHRHTCGETVENNRRQGRDQRRQTYHHRHTCGETLGDKKGRQDVGKADAPSDTGTCGETMGDNGRQWKTMGDNRFKGR